ncbi:glycoside hydrolase family 43 protein [Treponema sp. R80B11-R83G3]
MKNRKTFFKVLTGVAAVLVLSLALANCSNGGDSGGGVVEEKYGELFDTANGFPDALSNSWKIWGHRNALITQGFGADPSVMVYNDRVYVYASNDSLITPQMADPADTSTDKIRRNVGYNAGIHGLRVISSGDLANWTDHGLINVGGLPQWNNPLYLPMPPAVTSYQSRSWAPSTVKKTIDGVDKFFIYFGNSGNGIGVISGDSPIGPWTSPLNKLLIDRETPNCASVNTLFDPGVMVDDDGKGYMFFGGGSGDGNGRRVQLGDDMASLAGDPETFNVPCLFEDNEIVKINGKYYYSYVTNGGGNSFGLLNAQIAYMTSDEPLGTYSDPKGIMASPQSQLFTSDENNHHCIFTFKGGWYIAYHASRVAQAVGLGRYRSSQIDRVNINSQGVISTITMTKVGVPQKGLFDPYVLNEAETIGIQGGIFTRPVSDAGNGMVVTSIDSGDWVALYGVDFGGGAKKFKAKIRMPDTPEDYVGAIELRIDPAGDGVTGNNGNLDSGKTTTIKGGEVIGRVKFEGGSGQFQTAEIDLYKTVTGEHNLVFVFYSSLGARPITPGVNGNLMESQHKDGFEFDQWQFIK